jgi:hypothetical protein
MHGIEGADIFHTYKKRGEREVEVEAEGPGPKRIIERSGCAEFWS